MKLYTGKPENRLALTLQEWKRDEPGGPLRRVFPNVAHAEITRLYGLTICGWFIGVQRYQRRKHRNADMAPVAEAP